MSKLPELSVFLRVSADEGGNLRNVHSKDPMYIIYVFNNFIDFVNKYVLLTGSWLTLMGDAVQDARWRQGRFTEEMVATGPTALHCTGYCAGNTRKWDAEATHVQIQTVLVVLIRLLLDILASLPGSFESKCWRRRKSPKRSLQRPNVYHLCI